VARGCWPCACRRCDSSSFNARLSGSGVAGDAPVRSSVVGTKQQRSEDFEIYKSWGEDWSKRQRSNDNDLRYEIRPAHAGPAGILTGRGVQRLWAQGAPGDGA